MPIVRSKLVNPLGEHIVMDVPDNPAEAPNVPEQKREVWDHKTFKAFTVISEAAHQHKVLVGLQCQQCNEMVQFSVDPKDNSVAMDCPCTHRVFLPQ